MLSYRYANLLDFHFSCPTSLICAYREIALEVLKNETVGSFIVRESTTKSGCFALSLRVPREFQARGIAHYLILKTSRGYKIKVITIIRQYSTVPTSLLMLLHPPQGISYPYQ